MNINQNILKIGDYLKNSGYVKVSASRLKTFMLCPKKFWYRYFCENEEPANIYTMLGSSVHYAISEYFENGTQPEYSFMQKWDEISSGHNLDTNVSLYRRGLNILRDYRWYEEKPKFVEFEFNIPYPADKPFCYINGVFDQVYDWGVVDMKTNNEKPTKPELDNDLQFIIYHFAYTQLFGRKPQKMIWRHLMTMEDIEVNCDNKEHILYEAVVSLLNNVYWFRRTGKHCNYCFVKEFCLEGKYAQLNNSENL
jgi:CRISPR/Cas system-associated exonuclease Cas4 (RecB family)